MNLIEANRIELQNEAGEVKICLDACAPGGAVIRIVGEESCGIEIIASDSGPSIKLFSREGAIVAELSACGDNPKLMLFGDDKKPAVVLECHKDLRAMRLLIDGKMVWGEEIDGKRAQEILEEEDEDEPE